MAAPLDSPGLVVAVSRSAHHAFSKANEPEIRLAAGVGVEGDAHSGADVQHLSRRKRELVPNLRQVHLIHAELFDEVAAAGFTVNPGELGENVTTRGVDLLALPRGTRLHLGERAVVELTGLRNPCKQIDGFQAGLMRQLVRREPDGTIVRKAGVMSIVLVSGIVRAGDTIGVELPAGDREALAPV
ncbi:MOSC domain-containing protein [Cellulomonas chengniuliangii]|uniref:MOSC domain-containing protein n=1 Tax=Cellulomonas chengniuliangii TaxID=2968084 RepID=A0ABY5KYA8_9CELL|nr:MOSC domain-containing protein [Cellulomonas chengniuliangii]MCC2307836.1 MOSC domain-containing protein [Cellulomonas chengniuliangii]UUI75409.1 MOSC domain-containing protein [Cellulomonas chengniuliangii]